MGLRQSLRIAASTLLLACGLQFAHADVPRKRSYLASRQGRMATW
ncbi:hypothetical protein SEEPBA42_21598 [Salmonella enterica subsp. enterica serovar Paratyphi B str. SARA42]|nr:hypothetical protein SEEPBA42_21598 [Salmonella enterica subsp. enterica serovar Paratyphi B str. SARA42]